MEVKNHFVGLALFAVVIVEICKGLNPEDFFQDSEI